MKVELDLRTGPYPGRWPNQIDIQKNIDSLSRAIKGEPLSVRDIVLLNDTKSILEGIKSKLKKG